jgi:peptide/nickel transport system permease protein
VIRSAALVVRTMPYIDAARAAGYSHLRILLAHMAPNLAAPWLVLVTAFTAQTILLEASLSYLGVGVVEPAPAWGLMLSGMAVQTFAEAPWIVLFPGLAISLAVFAFSLLGDAMRDVLDPKFRR